MDRTYLVICFVTGCFYLVIVPPFQVPDEPNHFYRAYQISTGQIWSARQDDLWGGDLPRSLPATVEGAAGLPGYDPNQKVSIHDIVGALSRPLRPGRTIFVHFPNTALYSPAPYVPQAAGILFGRVLGLSPLTLLYLGRLANLVIAALLCAYAIKITPVFSAVLFLTAAMPMFIYEAASVSPDALTDALSLLFIALVLRRGFDSGEALQRTDLALLAGVAAALGLCKNVYAILALLVFLIPADRFGTRARYLGCCISICLLSFASSFAWILSVNRQYMPYLGAPSPDQPLGFILAHPLVFGKMIVFNLGGYSVFYVRSLVGHLGWADTPLPAALIAAYVAALCAAGIAGGRGLISRRTRLLFAAVAAAAIVLVVTSQFFIATPEGSSSIDRAQGRYFIPLAPLLFFTLANDALAARLGLGRLQRWLPAFTAATLGLALVFVVRRYYLP